MELLHLTAQRALLNYIIPINLQRGEESNKLCYDLEKKERECKCIECAYCAIVYATVVSPFYGYWVPYIGQGSKGRVLHQLTCVSRCLINGLDRFEHLQPFQKLPPPRITCSCIFITIWNHIILWICFK